MLASDTWTTWPINQNPPLRYFAVAFCGLMFHHFHGNGHPSDKQGSLSSEDFEFQLLTSGIEKVLAPHDWLDRLSQNKLESGHRCLTFDDGLRSQADVALPILKKHGLKAFWFVYSAPFEGIMPLEEPFRRFRTQCYSSIHQYYREFFSQAELLFPHALEEGEYQVFREGYQKRFSFYSEKDIRYRYFRDYLLDPSRYQALVLSIIHAKGLTIEDLARDLWLTNDHLAMLHREGHVLGLHSYDHPMRMADLSQDEQRSQYGKNYDHLRRICGRPVAMAHPCGSYNDFTLQILRELQVVCGFGSSMHLPPNRLLPPGPLEIPRKDSADLGLRISRPF